VVGGLLIECLRRSNPGVSLSLDIALLVVGVSCNSICFAIFLVVVVVVAVVVVVVVVALIFVLSNLCIRNVEFVCIAPARSCKNEFEFEALFLLRLHEEEDVCKIFMELNAVEGAFCLSVNGGFLREKSLQSSSS